VLCRRRLHPGDEVGVVSEGQTAVERNRLDSAGGLARASGQRSRQPLLRDVRVHAQPEDRAHQTTIEGKAVVSHRQPALAEVEQRALPQVSAEDPREQRPPPPDDHRQRTRPGARRHVGDGCPVEPQDGLHSAHGSRIERRAPALGERGRGCGSNGWDR